MLPKSHRLPWPGWLSIALEPRAYGALIYQLFSLPLGIAGFVWLATGLGLSLGLAILGVGILLGFGWLISIRAMALTQGRMAWSLSGMPSSDLALIPEGTGFWDRLKRLLTDPITWMSQLYVLLRLPLGIVGFTLLITLILLSSLCILVAGLQLAYTHLGPDGLAHFQAFGAPVTLDPGDFELPSFMVNGHAFARITAVAGGIAGLLGSLHLALALTWLDGCLAQVFLSRK